MNSLNQQNQQLDATRLIVIGDVGGHPHYLHDQLDQLDPNQPHHIIQTGDLLRARPQYYETNQQLVEIVQHYANQPHITWTQLYGNHETYPLTGYGPKHWLPIDACYSPQTLAALREWQTTGFIQTAYATSNTLYTHAGLTRGYWIAIGKPKTATDTASRLNRLTVSSIGAPSLQYQGCLTRDDGKLNSSASPVWATYIETVYGWVDGGHPLFGQVYGHDSPYDWSRRCWRRAPLPLTWVDCLRRVAVSSIDSGCGRVVHTNVDLTFGDPVDGLFSCCQTV